MSDSSTTGRPILDLIAGDCRARRQLHRGIRYILRRQFPMELYGFRKGGAQLGEGGGSRAGRPAGSGLDVNLPVYQNNRGLLVVNIIV